MQIPKLSITTQFRDAAVANMQLFIEKYSTYHYDMLIKVNQERLAVASIARDDPSTLPGDDPFPCARMHRDRNAR